MFTYFRPYGTYIQFQFNCTVAEKKLPFLHQESVQPLLLMENRLANIQPDKYR